MEENIKTPPQQPRENEIDLGIFFNLIGRIFQKLGKLIIAFFVGIYNVIIFILLFFKRRFLWLLLGGLLGLALGIYLQSSHGPSYFSNMIVRSNFESSRLLYNQIDYYNSLIRQQRKEELASIFNLKVPDANNLVLFEITPIDDDLEIAKLYRNTFLDYSRNSINGVDTQWTRVMKFADFKKNLKDYDFPLQEIRLYSKSPDVFTNVQQGIVRAISNNKTLQAIKNNSNKIFSDEEMMLRRSLTGLDSLRQAYNKRIIEIINAAKSQGTNVIVSDKDFRNPEIDLYDKELMIKDELINSRKRAIEQSDILQVYSDFNPSGTSESGFRKYLLKYSLFGFLAALGIILLYETYRHLSRLEKKQQKILS